MRLDATFPCNEHVGLRQRGFFTVRGPCRREYCGTQMTAQTLACRSVRDWTPTVDCRSTRCLVLRMHSRLHIEIMTRLRSRWSTCRPLLAHRAESAHQRHAATPTARWSSTATGSRSAAGARRGAPLARRPGCQPASSTIAGAYDTAASAFAGAVRADHRSRRSASRISPTVRRHQRRAVDAVCRGARRHLPPLPG